jgi:hypothetical protein
MLNRMLRTGGATLACLIAGAVTAAPTFKILYHERLDLTNTQVAGGQEHLSFDAYGRHFDLDLEANENIARGVPANRADIKPYKGTVSGQAASWVRLTRTRDGWRGVVNDGQDVYAIEPSGEVKNTAVQPISSDAASPVMYRLADAIMPSGAAYCGNAGDSSIDGVTAEKSFKHIESELVQKDTTGVATRQLIINAVADHTFTDAIGADPEGAIVARWDIVDGIWSSQVGIKIVLAPITILTDATDPFSDTKVATDLLGEVSGYRAGLPAHQQTGLTHLLTGRSMEGNIIGISYLGAVCDAAQAVSLSQSTISLTMGALIAAHELGHSFNAVHDGVPGSCESTPQTFLMAPTINFSNQFSACSLQAINARAATAACLRQIAPVVSSNPVTTGAPTGSASSSNSDNNPAGSTPVAGNGGGGRLDFVLLSFLTLGVLFKPTQSTGLWRRPEYRAWRRPQPLRHPLPP